MRRSASLAVLTFLAATGAAGQEVPSPVAFLGYEPGTRFTPHDRIVEYFDRVDAATGRVAVRRYGRTVEGRDLILAFVSSEANLARLEEIRLANLRRARLEPGDPGPDTTAIVWLSYNVHGNESVSSEVSMLALFALLGGDRSEWLDAAVVVIDPSINPDGRERYVEWYTRTVGAFPDAEPAAVEHEEPWPGGRGNHYLFDLNRDWTWFSQVETRARVAEYNRWMPHVHVDFHEQGVEEPYYFAPAVEPYHEVITPWQREFQSTIGAGNARVFDRNGWLYFTREDFDLLYPGYGDTFPTYGGAVGMTYEQGGSGRAGLAIRTAEGDTLRLSDRVAHHLATSLSTVETAAMHRHRLLAEFGRYFEDSITNPGGRYRTFVASSSSGADRLGALASHLDRLGIRYGTVAEPRSVEGIDYRTGQAGAATAAPGDLVVSANQPRGRLARVLLEPDAALADSATYDITAWALPYAYGIDGFATDRLLEPTVGLAVGAAARALDSGAGSGAWPVDSGVVSPARPLDSPAVTAGRPADSGAYAFAADWSSPEDARFLAAALRAGVSARVATEPFTSGGRKFGRGTLIFTRTGNRRLGDRLQGILSEAARQAGRMLFRIESGRVEDGRDFGSGSVRYVDGPRILVAYGEGVGSTSAGEVWHWFDERMRYPATRVSVGTLRSIPLDDWDVLVLPSGSYTGLSDEGELARLRGWVQRGGRIVALDGALRLFAGKEGFSLKTREPDGAKSDTARAVLRKYADRERIGIPEEVIGAVFAAEVDATHPLGFGLQRGYFVLRRTASSWPYLEGERVWNVGVVPPGAHRAGFVGHMAEEKTGKTLSFGVEEIGRGAVVYLADGPLFRAFWYEGELLFANAVFMPLR